MDMFLMTPEESANFLKFSKIDQAPNLTNNFSYYKMLHVACSPSPSPTPRFLVLEGAPISHFRELGMLPWIQIEELQIAKWHRWVGVIYCFLETDTNLKPTVSLCANIPPARRLL